MIDCSTQPSRATPPASRRSEVGTGIRMSVAAGLGMFPIGIAFGVLIVQAGLPWWLAPALSLAVYAGSLELLVVGMIVTAAPIATIALTAFFVNFRHSFYAFSFPIGVVRSPLARFYSMYALTDEAYAVTAARRDGWTSWRLLGLQLALQSYWVGGGLAGVVVAALLPARIEGLGFALCALFATLTLDACRSRREVPSLLLAAASFAAALLLVPDTALFAGLLLFVTSLVVRFALVRRREANRA